MAGLNFSGTGGLAAASALNPATAALAAAPAVYQGVEGIIQRIQGARMAKSAIRPEYQAPSAQVQALAGAQNLAYGQAPGSQVAKDLRLQGMGSSIAGIRSSGGSTAERMAALSSLNNNANLSAMELAANDQQFKLSAAQNLQNQQMQFAQTQDKIWQMNKQQPFLDTAAKAAELQSSGTQNIHGAITGIGGAVASGLTKKEGDANANLPDWLKKILGNSPAAQADTQPFLPDGLKGLPSNAMRAPGDMSDPTIMQGGNQLNPNTPDVIKNNINNYNWGITPMKRPWE